MAILRPARLTGSQRATLPNMAGPTVITGTVATGWTYEGVVKEGSSDADIGPTTQNISGWHVSGWLELDDYSQIDLLLSLSTVALELDYTLAGGQAKTRIFHGVMFHQGDPPIPNPETPGTTGRFRVPFTAVNLKLDLSTASTTPGHVEGASPSDGTCTVANVP